VDEVEQILVATGMRKVRFAEGMTVQGGFLALPLRGAVEVGLFPYRWEQLAEEDRDRWRQEVQDLACEAVAALYSAGWRFTWHAGALLASPSE
jgi:hypothetical protein